MGTEQLSRLCSDRETDADQSSHTLDIVTSFALASEIFVLVNQFDGVGGLFIHAHEGVGT